MRAERPPGARGTRIVSLMSAEILPHDHPHAARLEKGTGTSLETWARRLDEAGARELDHTAIARLLVERW